MATVAPVTIERSGPAISAALAEHAPGERVRFESELRTALAGAAESLDVAAVEAVLARWHSLATMAANPLSAAETAQVERARTGDLTGFRVRDEHGNRTTI